MVAHFHTEYRLIQLSVALYLAVNAGLQLVMGPLSDRWGRRPVVLWGVGLFLLATIGCIFAPDITVFLSFRMIQASVVVAMVLSRAIVRDMVPQDRAASMIGYVTMGMAVVPMVGPAFGGVLDEAFGWQANFWALFVTSRRFWGYALAAGLSSGAFFAYLGGAPFVGDQVFGMTPAALGLFFGAPAIGYFLGNFASGRFSTRMGVNRMVLCGALANAGGIGLNLALFHAGLGTPASFFGLMTFMGLGNGMVIPNATAGALSIRPDLAGTASGLSGALMIGLGAALSALAGLLLTPERGAFALLWLMFLTGLAAVITILLVIRRERRLRMA
jgi:DHA1 family bicyclomycin/chloramphenicol resistance-like MFS transporter